MTRTSINFNLKSLSRRDLLILAGTTLLVSVIYLLVSRFVYALGFPLDDSWIHQTYARNLALHGEWSFRAGTPSAGSTSPLWSALLALGFLLRLAPYVWTYLLGGLILLALAILLESAARVLVASYRPKFPWVGIFIALEWHFVWAALSGMETLLHGLLLTSVLILLLTRARRYLLMGLLTGLAVWARPDGLTLLGPVMLVIFLAEQDTAAMLSALSKYLLGFAALFSFYIFFNLAMGGTPMPNTFYAKQAEYTYWQAKPLLERAGQLSLQLFVGPSLALAPGIFAWAFQAVHKKIWERLAVLLWALGYFGLYISRLPVYQHGRYIMPAMPIFFFFGLLAFAEFDKSKTFKRYHWIGQAVWRGALAMLTAGFIFLGANSYAQDVAFIESEMVVSAKWAAQNLPPEAIIAAHDIGALGFFDGHELIDLAGLISPEVIPIIHDEPRLAQYLDQRGVEYLIAFPNFYSELTRSSSNLFSTNSPVTRNLGQQNMVIYHWKRPE